MNQSAMEKKNNFLKGIGNKETARELLQIVMNNCENFHFKITIKDNREILGSLTYVDKYYLFLTNSEEHYKGSKCYIRNCGDILIPLNIIKKIEIEKSYFDRCYEQLEKA
ncbi:conserved Plasmodium protein, unknown function [Plasmodium sp. DRC-Itaito]|nr:conserved Plasmodium protein, unknown function [Plasmodium sp. DRC-Itaito]